MHLLKQALATLKRVHNYQRVYKNWFTLIWQVRKGNDKIYVKLKDGSSGICSIDCVHKIVNIMQKYSQDFDTRKFHFQNNEILYYLTNSIAYPAELALFNIEYGVNFNNEEDPFSFYYDSEKKIITTPDGLRFTIEGFDSLIFAETFLYDVHNVCVDLKDKIVIHGGAYVGETALYYAKRGAKVYAFEPNDDCYRIAVKNLSLNPDLAERVVLKNYALGLDGEVEFPAISCSGGASVYEKKST